MLFNESEYLDFCDRVINDARPHGPAVAIAHELRRRISASTGETLGCKICGATVADYDNAKELLKDGPARPFSGRPKAATPEPRAGDYGGDMAELLERFWSKVMPEPNSGCWLWEGAVNRKGYATFSTGLRADGSRRSRLAHRFSYEQFRGQIQEGLQLDHLCRIRCCVNPAHLEAVTCKTNVLRGVGSSAERARQERCKRGHALSIDKRGQRYCKTCAATLLRALRAKNKLRASTGFQRFSSRIAGGGE